MQERALKTKIARLKIQANIGHSDLRLAHSDFVRDAALSPPQYTLLIKFCKEEQLKKIQDMTVRRLKLGPTV